MTWECITNDEWKTHIVPSVLADLLVEEMKQRGVKGDVKRRVVPAAGVDCGGMCHRDRPIEEFRFAGLKFSVASEFVQHFADELQSLEERHFGKRPYFKLHSHWNAVVLTPAQRKTLLALLLARVDKAEARATAFYRDIKPSNVVLAEAANRHGGNLKPEELGPDRQARFRRKARS